MVILRCLLKEDGKEMYQELNRTCTAIVLLIEPFVSDVAVAVVVFFLGSLRKPRRQRQRR